MKKSFTLMELIFVVVIIGILAAVAVPKFLTTEVAASRTNLKSVISSVESGIENIHGQWLINDSFKWNSSCDFNDSTGYPKNLDNGEPELFSCILKKPIFSCKGEAEQYRNCFTEPSSNEYRYYFSPTEYVLLKYYEDNGSIECSEDSNSYSISQCKSILY